MAEDWWQPIKGYCGFENEDGVIAVVGTAEALTLARRYEPFPVYRMLNVLTSRDFEPDPGVVVRDHSGRAWQRSDVVDGRRCWMPLDENGDRVNDDPESWTRVAGNFGPVTVLTPLSGRWLGN